MKRPILIITLGFIAGIIWGLYINIVPFVFLITIFINLFVKIIKIKANNNCIRILNIFIKKNIILVFLISSLIFSLFLYKELTKSIDKENRTIFIWFIILQSIGHGIFAFMNWGSFLFLTLSLIAIILLVISYINEKKEN